MKENVTPEITIRKADRADLPALLKLYQQLESSEKTLSLVDLELQFNKLQSQPSFQVFVAEWQGVVVGTYELLIMQNLAHHCRPSAIVEDVVVSQAARGQGIGKAMMQHAMSLARERGCYKLVLSSNLSREGAHRFYEALGFKQHGISFLVE